MRRPVFARGVLPLAAVVALGGACENDDPPMGGAGGTGGAPAAPMTAEPSAETKQLLTATGNYKTWSKFPDFSTPKRSPTHQNMFVVTYQNDVVARATATPLPDGAIIVKENFMGASDPTPMALTIMSKQGGAWYWVQSTPAGKVFLDDKGKPLEGKGVAMCTTCHTAANDSVIGRTFSGGGAMPAPKTADPSSETRQVWALLANYKTWPKFAENPSPKRSATHENMFVVSYHNQAVAQAITSKTLPLPDGALIVKENYAKADDSSPMALTIMHKQGGAWYWIKAMADGKVFLDDAGKAMEGKNVAMCTMCHKASTNDAVLTHNFKN